MDVTREVREGHDVIDVIFLNLEVGSLQNKWY